MEPFIGQIMMFGGTFAPIGWAKCDGQLLAISQYSALFSILGTTYGGDGRTVFGLPDLRGRSPVHAGQGPGLSNYSLGQSGGAETTFSNLAHTHLVQVPATVGEGETGQPTGKVLAAGEFPALPYGTTADTNLANFNTAYSGSGGSVTNLSPYETVTFVIALVGIFPSRN